jgi:hypothetical protein
MATKLVSGGRIKDGVFEAYNKDTKSYVSTGEKVNKDDFGKTEVGKATSYTGGSQPVAQYMADYKPSTGIVTSKDAENRAKTADETLNKITTPSTDKNNPFTDLFSRISALQTELNKAKEAEKSAKEEAAGLDANSALKKLGSSEEVGSGAKADMSAGVDAIAGRGGTSGIEDATIRALADKTIANIDIINNQLQALSQYRQQFNEYTQQDIDSIARTAERSIQTQTAENQRIADAMRFAGVLGGRAQFAPVAEQSIIKDVIQEGLDKIEVINEKKNSAIREARKAEAEFNIDVFEQQAELAKEYNNEIESTISAMNAQVRQVEQDERERMTFRQQQEERNSLILAEELVDATPEQIMQAAAMNGIDIGLLTKAVNDAKFEKESRDLEKRSKEENILSSQESRANEKTRLGFERARLNLEQSRFDRDSQEEKDVIIPKDVEQGLRSVAQLSEQNRKDIWLDIQDFGLNKDAVEFWLEDRAFTKAQVKGIVKAHEQSQRIKGTDDSGEKDVYLPTETEKALFDHIDKYKTATNKRAEKEIMDIVSKKKYGTINDTKVKGKYDGPGGSFFKQN